MRSTRAAAAIHRLNRRCPQTLYTMASSGNGLFQVIEQRDSGDTPVSEPLPLDDFVKFVNAMGPQEVRRITKNDAAFEKQLVKKEPT
jgi:hypothetical protein